MFSLKNLDNKYIHLTNEAVQTSNKNFGRFELGNKLSFSDY